MTYMFIYDQYFVIKKNASAQIIQYCFVYKKHSCLINDIKHTHSSKVFKLCVCRKGKRGGGGGGRGSVVLLAVERFFVHINS